MKGSLQSFDGSDTPSSLRWEHLPYCNFSCCDHPFIYPLQFSLSSFVFLLPVFSYVIYTPTSLNPQFISFPSLIQGLLCANTAS